MVDMHVMQEGKQEHKQNMPGIHVGMPACSQQVPMHAAACHTKHDSSKVQRHIWQLSCHPGFIIKCG